MLRRFGATQFHCSSVIRVAVARLVVPIPQRFKSRQGPAHLLLIDSMPCHAHPKRVSATLGSHIFSLASSRLVSTVPRLSFAKRFRSASPQGLRHAYPCCPFLLRVTAPRCLCSASPFNANAGRSSAAPSPFVSMSLLLYALAFCAALFCAFARPLAANPTQCRSYPSNSAACHRDSSPRPFFAPPLPVDAVLFRCNFSLCRAFPSQNTALPLLSASVPLHIGASPLQASAARSCSIARLLDAHRCNSSAIRVTAMPMPRFSLLSQYTAPQSSPLLFRCQS
jgi:hypothetical protein